METSLLCSTYILNCGRKCICKYDFTHVWVYSKQYDVMRIFDVRKRPGTTASLCSARTCVGVGVMCTRAQAHTLPACLPFPPAPLQEAEKIHKTPPSSLFLQDEIERARSIRGDARRGDRALR